jgi:hypothetical protein
MPTYRVRHTLQVVRDALLGNLNENKVGFILQQGEHKTLYALKILMVQKWAPTPGDFSWPHRARDLAATAKLHAKRQRAETGAADTRGLGPLQGHGIKLRLPQRGRTRSPEYRRGGTWPQQQCCDWGTAHCHRIPRES